MRLGMKVMGEGRGRRHHHCITHHSQGIQLHFFVSALDVKWNRIQNQLGLADGGQRGMLMGKSLRRGSHIALGCEKGSRKAMMGDQCRQWKRGWFDELLAFTVGDARMRNWPTVILQFQWPDI